VKRVVIVLLTFLAVLHQDFWWWDSIDPMVFGFLPIGLAYHAGMSLAAAFLWFLVAAFCWPKDLEVSDAEAAAPKQQRGEL